MKWDDSVVNAVVKSLEESRVLYEFGIDPKVVAERLLNAAAGALAETLNARKNEITSRAATIGWNAVVDTIESHVRSQLEVPKPGSLTIVQMMEKSHAISRDELRWELISYLKTIAAAPISATTEIVT